MVSTDPVSDMLTRIRNAMLVGKNEVDMPYSKFKHNVADKLVKSGFIEKAELDKGSPFKRLRITINKPGSNPNITEINRISKPGRRMYVSVSDIPTIKQGRGLVIVSTSKGLLTGEEAKKQRVGGELICKVY